MTTRSWWGGECVPSSDAWLTDGGIAVPQVITIAESRYAAYRQRPDFIQRRIFPSGMLPTLSHIQR